MKNMGPTALCVGYRLRYLGENPAKPSKRIVGETPPQAFSRSRRYHENIHIHVLRLFGDTDVVVDASRRIASARYCKTFPPRSPFLHPNVWTACECNPPRSTCCDLLNPSVSDTLLSTLASSCDSPVYSARSLNSRLVIDVKGN